MATLTQIMRAEARIERAAARAVRATLAVAERTAYEYADTLMAQAETEGELLLAIVSSWAENVEDLVIPAVLDAFLDGYDNRNIAMTPQGRAAIVVALSRVHDLLTEQGLTRNPFTGEPIRESGLIESRARLGLTTADEMFAVVQESLSFSISQGHSTRRTRDRIASSLAWEASKGADRREIERLDAELDAILDAIGPPTIGTGEDTIPNPARIAALDEEPALSIRREQERLRRRVEAERSLWKNRAERIARTEGTRSINGGEIIAAQVEQDETGEPLFKTWKSTEDRRTRAEHVSADEQCRPIDQPFIVGGERLMYPGDPNGSGWNTIQCRCTVLVVNDPCPEE